ncbi:hypothetical protein RUND412_000007 [Rhizina undulata]
MAHASMSTKNGSEGNRPEITFFSGFELSSEAERSVDWANDVEEMNKHFGIIPLIAQIDGKVEAKRSHKQVQKESHEKMIHAEMNLLLYGICAPAPEEANNLNVEFAVNTNFTDIWGNVFRDYWLEEDNDDNNVLQKKASFPETLQEPDVDLGVEDLDEFIARLNAQHEEKISLNAHHEEQQLLDAHLEEQKSLDADQEEKQLLSAHKPSIDPESTSQQEISAPEHSQARESRDFLGVDDFDQFLTALDSIEDRNMPEASNETSQLQTTHTQQDATQDEPERSLPGIFTLDDLEEFLSSVGGYAHNNPGSLSDRSQPLGVPEANRLTEDKGAQILEAADRNVGTSNIQDNPNPEDPFPLLNDDDDYFGIGEGDSEVDHSILEAEIPTLDADSQLTMNEFGTEFSRSGCLGTQWQTNSQEPSSVKDQTVNVEYGPSNSAESPPQSYHIITQQDENLLEYFLDEEPSENSDSDAPSSRPEISKATAIVSREFQRSESAGANSDMAYPRPSASETQPSLANTSPNPKPAASQQENIPSEGRLQTMQLINEIRNEIGKEYNASAGPPSIALKRIYSLTKTLPYGTSKLLKNARRFSQEIIDAPFLDHTLSQKARELLNEAKTILLTVDSLLKEILDKGYVHDLNSLSCLAVVKVLEMCGPHLEKCTGSMEFVLRTAGMFKLAELRAVAEILDDLGGWGQLLYG